MKHGDPVPAIAEAAATGETATIFADLRATLGVNVVNLIWRHIATFPGALAWAWSTIRRILASYNRSNAMNLAALSALVRRIDGVPPATSNPSAAMDLPQEAGIEGTLPKLLTLSEVAPATAALIREINLLGDRAEGRIIASMYRHLAHWPGYLALAHVQLQPLAADGCLERMIGQALQLGDTAGARLQAGMADLRSPGSAVEVRRAATDFMQHAISKMVPVAALLQQCLPDQANYPGSGRGVEAQH
jgi:hypothetical protein